MAHLWAEWLRHPCRLGDPHRFRARGQDHRWPTCGQSGYVTVAVSGIPTASERGGGDQKWPTSGQSGYVTIAVSGDPTAAERGARSEVAHLWAKWLRHPCRLGDPHRFRAGGKIRSGPLVGKVANAPLPPRGSPTLQSGGNQKWPTSGQSGYINPAVSGIATALERLARSEVAHKWAKWLRHPCRLGDPRRLRAGGKFRSGPQVGKVATSPLPPRGSPPLRSGGQIRSGPLVGKVAMSPLPSRGSPPLQSGEENQKWPTCGQSGYVTPAVSRIPTAAERGKSEVAHKWAKWLRQPCRVGDRHRFRAGGKIRSGSQVGKVATSPLPSRGCPPLQSGGGEIRSGPLVGKVATSPLPSRRSPPLGKVATSLLPSRGSPPLQSGGNQKWPTSGQSGYVNPAVSGIATASERVARSQVAHKWAKWLRHPCRLGDPHRFTAGGKIRSGPQVGKVATSPLPSRGSPPLSKVATSLLPSRGSPPLQSGGGKSEVAHKWAKWLRHPCRLGDPHRFRAGGGNQKWPTCGQSGYVTPAVSGIATASERGARSEVAHKWAKWLRHPCRLGDRHRWAKWLRHSCRLGDPHRFRAGGGGIRSGPQVGKVATPPLPSRGSPPLQSGGGKQKWPTSGLSGYVTPAASGIPTASEWGARSEVAHKWAKWLRHPCRLGDPHRFRAGGGNHKWPTSGQSGYVTPAVSGIATAGQSGYVTPAVSGIPTASERGGKSEVAHKWAKWLHRPCRLGDPHRFKAGGESRSGPQVGKVATSPLPSRGSRALQSGEENNKWPNCGQNGYVNPAASGIPTASERGRNQKWPTSGQSGYVTPAASGIPTASERGPDQKWPTCGQSGYVTPAVSGIPTASEWGGKSEVAHLWAKWLRHPCRLADPHRCRAGEIRSGPQVGKVAKSTLPSRGSPPLQSGWQDQKWLTSGQSGYVTLAVSGMPTASERGGGNQKWPTCGQSGYVTPAVSAIATAGQSGYVTPAVSGIPTAAERGKSEVAHKWAKWLRQPCRLGDRHRFRAGG